MDVHSAQSSYLDPDSLAKLDRLLLDARQPMQGGGVGRHKSPHKGTSVEFAEYREYLPGDDLRRLDWRAYGRSDRFYIKEFEADSNLRLCLVVDTSGSMGYGDPSLKGATDCQRSKFEFAAHMAALLGYVALRQGDGVGLTLASERDGLHLPARRKTSHFQLVQDSLRAVKTGGKNALAEALHGVAERVPRRAMVVILSDFFAQPGELEKALQHLKYRKHDAVMFQLLARREADFDFDRTTRFVDLEGGAPLVGEPAIVGKRYRAAWQRYRKGMADAVRNSNADYREVWIEGEPADSVCEFLLARMQRGGRR